MHLPRLALGLGTDLLRFCLGFALKAVVDFGLLPVADGPLHENPTDQSEQEAHHHIQHLHVLSWLLSDIQGTRRALWGRAAPGVFQG
ncbi:hypothetical protein GCM10010914_19360 [Deinococcus wulumuqiensis]|uniref:Secreted protein n=1 Tax=Deinococcus wulumuqiensis TaxID=980427 RepID=A0AAV4K4T5_9DEIO|nr:hypothetical protein GCM10010914_19360 [Deinococcus wulumuqiensis]GGP29925.1 hypothetical protein GCM10008021_15760 [Deinococcus wulumuqiensis]